MNRIFYAALFSFFFSQFSIAQDCGSIFISEYVEGWSNNKALEIYNPTSSPVDMSLYQLHRWNNGTAIKDPNYTLSLSGIVPAKGVIVYVRDSAQGGVWNQLKAKANVYLSPNCDNNSSNRTFCFNGNDALTLELKGSPNPTIVDGFGYIGDDPGNPTGGGGWNNVSPAFQAADTTEFAWTTDHTLIRKYNVVKGISPPSKPAGNPAWNVSVQWDSVKVNTFDSLGRHRCACENFVGIKAIEYAKFEMYPNPTADVVSISSEEAIAEVRITNLKGQLMLNRKYFQQALTLNLRANDLADGIYLIHVRTESNKTATKMVQLMK
jgi:hypothetical protein